MHERISRNYSKALVDNPDMVQVNEIAGEQSIILELKVAQEDMGK